MAAVGPRAPRQGALRPKRARRAATLCAASTAARAWPAGVLVGVPGTPPHAQALVVPARCSRCGAQTSLTIEGETADEWVAPLVAFGARHRHCLPGMGRA